MKMNTLAPADWPGLRANNRSVSSFHYPLCFAMTKGNIAHRFWHYIDISIYLNIYIYTHTYNKSILIEMMALAHPSNH